MTKVMALAAMMCSSALVQAQFFTQVGYMGALDTDPAKDWTATGWTNFNPKATNYAAVTDTVTLNGIDGGANGKKVITGALTLDASKVYLLKGIIVVADGATLTIPAGTLIRGKADLTTSPKNYATLVVERGGKLIANGTATKPVVFTSWKTSGRDRGDWGGIVICGKAPNNQGADVQIEGFNNVAFDNTLAKFGGTVSNDNSGSLQYVRIEFAGLAFEANKEVNSLTLGSVGSGTTIDYVQTSYGNDDAYEWFGGNVSAKHLISYITTDDDFDTDFGWGGAVQFAIAVRDSSYFDLTWNAPTGSSTSETFESDNDAAGSGKLPYTRGVFSNVTCVGPVPIGSSWSQFGSTSKGAFRRGARIRRNSRLSVINSIFMGYRNFLMYDGDSSLNASGVPTATFPNTATGMLFRNNLIVNTNAAFAPASSTANGLVEVATANSAQLTPFDTWIKDATNGNKINPVAYTAGTVLIDPKNPVAPNFRPVSGSPAIGGTNFDLNRLAEFGVLNAVKTISSVEGIRAFPNPAQNQITLEFTAQESLKAVAYISDIQGRVIANLGQKNITAGYQELVFSTSSLNNGVYFLNLETAAGRISQRIAVQK
ncbi:MAG: T9SS type A sorting domain-containing protein [Bacteroidetes bacterium]|nr:T9SS type A sorting domain-containing protein [Bacteroidota bacterium]